MTIEEIEDTINAFADAALRVKDSGFDGVELHGGTAISSPSLYHQGLIKEMISMVGPWKIVFASQ
jgi:hypothetical protein